MYQLNYYEWIVALGFKIQMVVSTSLAIRLPSRLHPSYFTMKAVLRFLLRQIKSLMINIDIDSLYPSIAIKDVFLNNSFSEGLL